MIISDVRHTDIIRYQIQTLKTAGPWTEPMTQLCAVCGVCGVATNQLLKSYFVAVGPFLRTFGS